jgi:hypothetical protein
MAKKVHLFSLHNKINGLGGGFREKPCKTVTNKGYADQSHGNGIIYNIIPCSRDRAN